MVIESGGREARCVVEMKPRRRRVGVSSSTDDDDDDEAEPEPEPAAPDATDVLDGDCMIARTDLFFFCPGVRGGAAS